MIDSTKATKVLVLDANQRSALATVRSLGILNNNLVFTADSSPAALAGTSKYSQEYFQHPSTENDPSSFLNWLAKHSKEQQYDAVFPMTEITSRLLLANKHILGEIALPFADYDTVLQLSDKGALHELANQLDIPVPKYTYYDDHSEVDIDSYLEFPVVLKPCLSRVYKADSWESTAVHIAHTPMEMRELLESKPYFANTPFMVQTYIAGHGAGVFALYNQGKPVAFFSHKRIREKPPSGGVSVLSESAPLDPTLLSHAKSLLNAAQWHGVAMVEFKIAEDGTPYLMEINTRFWGSLQLAIDSGVDFPKLLWQITLDNNDQPTLTEYTVGQRLRWLLGDLDNLYITAKDPRISLASKLKALLNFLTPSLKSTKHEVNRIGDLRPAIYELKAYIRGLKK